MTSKYVNKYNQKMSVIKVHYIYEAIWMPTIAEELLVQSGHDNKRNEDAVRTSFGIWEDEFCVVLHLISSCQWWIRIGIRERTISTRSADKDTRSVRQWTNNTVRLFQSDVAIPFDSNPRFLKRPMSNLFHLLMAMIKVRPTGMWIASQETTAE